MSHPCPAPGCPVADVPQDQFACRGHWYSLPKAMQRAIWTAWDKGRGAGSAEHRAAIAGAARYLERRAQS